MLALPVMRVFSRPHREQLVPLLKKWWINAANTSTLNQRWLSTFIDVVSTSIIWLKMKVEPTYIYGRCFSVETTLIELRWFNVDEPTLLQRWNLVENESWADVCLSMLFQCWQNNVETKLIELLWFNVDDPMLFQRCFQCCFQCCFNTCSSVLRKQHWSNFVNISCTEVH